MRSTRGAARSTVLALAQRLDWGTLVIEDEAGTRHVCGTGAPTVEVHVHDDRVWSARSPPWVDRSRRVLRTGLVGL